MNGRYARQSLLPWIGPEGQSRIEASTVAVVGLGALGCTSAALLARAGVGKILLVDRDIVEETNLPRQILYSESDARERLPKAVAAAAHLREARSDLDVMVLSADLDADLAKQLFAECAVVLDGTDNFETRYLINDASVASGAPWIYGGAVGSEGALMAVLPGSGPCLRCIFPEAPPAGSAPTCDTVGVLGPAASAIASMQAAEALKILAGRRDLVSAGLRSFDFLSGHTGVVHVARDPACPCCAEGRFDYLNEAAGSRTHRLCGRDAVLVLAAKGTALSLEALAERLRSAGPVFCNKFILQTEWESHPVTIYPDGRAVIQKTDDPAKARALYARYLGH